jgi:hypothetical protein
VWKNTDRSRNMREPNLGHAHIQLATFRREATDEPVVHAALAVTCRLCLLNQTLIGAAATKANRRRAPSGEVVYRRFI